MRDNGLARASAVWFRFRFFSLLGRHLQHDGKHTVLAQVVFEGVESHDRRRVLVQIPLNVNGLLYLINIQGLAPLLHLLKDRVEKPGRQSGNNSFSCIWLF